MISNVDYNLHKQKPEIFKIENIIGLMQNPYSGIIFRNQKLFLTSIPAVISGNDLIRWISEKFYLDEHESNHMANMLMIYGYIYPISNPKSETVKDDVNSLYRFQAPYFWLSKFSKPDAIDYAIYLVKRSIRNRQKYGLEEYELAARDKLQKNMCDKWEFVCIQAEEQIRLNRERRKSDRLVIEAQERAFWLVHRPPPNRVCRLEENVPKNSKNILKKIKENTAMLAHTTVSKAKSVDNICLYVANHSNYDWFVEKTDFINPWCVTESTSGGGLSLDSAQLIWPKISCPFLEGYRTNSDAIKNPLSFKQVKLWGINFDQLLKDKEGMLCFQRFLNKEFSVENISFWISVINFKFGPISTLATGCKQIVTDYLSENAYNEINLDRKTMAITEKNMETPNWFTFDDAQEHIYTLMKNDSYVRFLRSEDYGAAMRKAVEGDQMKMKTLKAYNLGISQKDESTIIPQEITDST